LLFRSFHRFWKSRPHLAPKEPGEAAYRAWLAELGETEPADGLGISYIDIAELCGWDVATEPKRPTSTLPDVVVLPAERREPLSGADAARQFVTWIRDTASCGVYAAPDLAALYSSYCEQINRTETPMSTLARYLRRQPGVSTCIKDLPGPSFLEGRRVRGMMWTILPEADIQPEPERAAA
jgi:hypothetical protein